MTVHGATAPPIPELVATPEPVDGRTARRGSGSGLAPHRIRDLDRRGRLVAALVALALVVPVGASVVRGLDVGWLPTGDNALIVLRAYDVPTGDPPLVGQPSTADLYTPGVAARHPGPIEYYLLAGPIRLLGPDLGTLLVVAGLTGGSVLLTTWTALRRGGPAVALGASVLLGLVMWSSGLALLTDPISSNVGGYPLIAGSALAWALWCDDRRLWPVAALVWSFTIQQHLAIFGIAGLVAAWGVAGAVVTTIGHRAEPGRLRSSARWAGAALVGAVLCWTPVLVDQVAGTGNLGRIVTFSGQGREGLGPGLGLRAAGRAIAAPPLVLSRDLAHPNLGGWLILEELDGGALIGVVVGVLALAGAGVAAVRWWRRGDDDGRLVALVATAVVLAVAGGLTTSQVPDSLEAGRINFYRWVWPTCIAAWGAVAWALGRGLSRTAVADRPRRHTVAALLALLTLVVTVTATATGDGDGDRRRDEPIFRFARQAADEVERAAPRDRPVRIVTSGGAAYLALAPALAVALVEAGWEVRVDPAGGDFWDHRARAAQPGETVVSVESGPPTPAAGEGTVVAREQLELTPEEQLAIWGNDTFTVRVDVPRP